MMKQSSLRNIVILAIVALIAVSVLPVDQSEDPTFANPIFQRLWNEQSTQSTVLDLWGREPLLWRVEPYADAPDGRRVVQYFDRGRMELIRTENGSVTEVTQGLLTQEMISGTIHLGGDLVEQRPPPEIAIDSGEWDGRIATYASLQNVVQHAGQAEQSQARQVVRDWIDSSGEIVSGEAVETVRLTQYVTESDHNLPDVTVRLFERQPFANRAWVQSLGFPISEPYWTIYRRNGVPLPSLVQVFERRILVYTPSLPDDQQFTVSNAGRHYYKWRYGADAPAQLPNPQAGIASGQISVPAGYEAGIYARGMGTPIGLATGSSGELWILTQQGKVHRVTAEDADGAAGKTSLYAEGLPNPRGIAVIDGQVYVTVDDGVVRLTDNTGDNVADAHDYVTRNIEPVVGPRGAPAVDESGRLLVSGTELPDRQGRIIARIEAGEDIAVVGDQFVNPGPILASRQRLYVVEQQHDGSSTVHRLQTGTQAELSASDDSIARFGTSETITCLVVFDKDLWPQLPVGTIFATVNTSDGGSVVQIIPGNGSGSEIIEFATGFTRPAAMAAGIDGALYVADAGSGQVIKIVTAERHISQR